MSKIIALNSGGYDSVVMISALAKEDPNVEIVSVFFDYGQRNAPNERECAKKLSDKIGGEFIELSIPKLSWCKADTLYSDKADDKENQYIEMRNLIFLSYVTSLAESMGISEVYVAFCFPGKETEEYTDTTPEFLSSFNTTISPTGVTVFAPYHDLSKAQIGMIALEMGIEEDYFSCNVPVLEDGSDTKLKPCGECSDCKYLSLMKKTLK